MPDEREPVLTEDRRVRFPGADALARRPHLGPLTGRGIDLPEHRVAAAERRVREASVRAPSEPRDVGVLQLHDLGRPAGHVHQDRPAGHELSIAARRLDRRHPRAVGRRHREPELDVARREHPIVTGRGVDQHQRRRVPRRFAGILRRHRDDGSGATPFGLPDVQPLPRERPDLARRHLDHPEAAPHEPVLPRVHLRGPAGQVLLRLERTRSVRPGAVRMHPGGPHEDARAVGRPRMLLDRPLDLGERLCLSQAVEAQEEELHPTLLPTVREEGQPAPVGRPPWSRIVLRTGGDLFGALG